MRTEYCVVNGCNHVLSVAEEIKLSYMDYSHIHYKAHLCGQNRFRSHSLCVRAGVEVAMGDLEFDEGGDRSYSYPSLFKCLLNNLILPQIRRIFVHPD